MAVYDVNGNIISGESGSIPVADGVKIRKVNSINHRGYNYTAPENTIPAFKLSKTNGFDMVETDVLFTSDNIPVLLHDTTINRTGRNADGTTIETTISIKDITYEQALEYDFGVWKSQTYAGTKIPTLEEFLILCKNLAMHPYIEIKNDGSYSNEQIQIITDLVEDCGMLGCVTYISFKFDYLTKIANLVPSARIGLLVNSLTQAGVNNALSLKNGQNDVFIDTGYSPSALPDVSLARNANVPLEIWTVSTASWITNMDAYITGVTSNSLVASDVLYNANIS